MKNKLLRFVCSFITAAIRWGFFLKVFNSIYEKAPQRWVNIFHRYVRFPNRSYTWVIHLRNNKQIKTLVKRNNYKTLQFAIDYKWYSPGISIVENTILDGIGNEGLYIDIGANLGMRSLCALSNGQQVIMFEPNDEVSDLNEERCRMNGFENYEIVRKGVSDKSGNVRFAIDSSSYKSSISPVSSTEIDRTINIETVSLDDHFKDAMPVGKDIYVKVDIEGHERQMVAGAKRMIRETSPIMLIEINEKGENFESIYSGFHEFGYSCYALFAERWGEDILKKVASTEDTGTIDNAVDFLFLKNKSVEERLKKYMA